MMMNDIMKNELNEQEMSNVAGGNNFPPHFWDDFEKALKKDEEARKKAEAAKSGAHAHNGGASGSW